MEAGVAELDDAHQAVVDVYALVDTHQAGVAALVVVHQAGVAVLVDAHQAGVAGLVDVHQAAVAVLVDARQLQPNHKNSDNQSANNSIRN